MQSPDTTKDTFLDTTYASAEIIPENINIPGLYPNRNGPRRLGAIENFVIAAIAPAIAVVFTNPFDTAKVRLQLQGQTGTSAVSAHYKSSFDALYKIWIKEGMSGLQKGLVPAVLREGSKNFFRIGMFDPIMNILHSPERNKLSSSAPAWKRVIAGSLCGVMGAVSCNPFELVKTRLQSAASGKMAVGHQHGYTGVISAIKQIYGKEGVKGLYRGSLLSMGRSIVGSGANLSSFSIMREYLNVERKWKDGALLDCVCGLASGLISCLFMNPIDVIRTRYYNQPYVNGKGVLYASGIDAVNKIISKEGPKAFYKGFLSHFLRIGPHFCLTFVFLGIIRRSTLDYYQFLDRKETFAIFDKDRDGKLNGAEIESALVQVFTPLSDRAPDKSILQSYSRWILSHSKHDAVDLEDYEVMEKFVKAEYCKRMK